MLTSFLLTILLAIPCVLCERTNIFSGSVPDLSENCFSVPNALCVGGTSQMITGDSVSWDLVGWWNFDEIYPIDHSGNGNHMHPEVRSGPAFYGYGASAAFDGKKFGVISGNTTTTLSSPSVTVAFWVYLLQNSTDSWRTLISKGASAEELTPAILLWPNSRRIHVRVSTDMSWNEGLDSQGVIPLRRWTHVAVTADKNLLTLYLNGVKDSQVILGGNTIGNTGDIHVGGDPFRAGFVGYMDDLRYYKIALPMRSIQALLPGSVTGIALYDFITLGKLKTTYEEAVEAAFCSPTYHLCSLEELYSGGFHVTRISGWLSTTEDVWYSNMKNEGHVGGAEKMALCCKDADDLSSLEGTTPNDVTEAKIATA